MTPESAIARKSHAGQLCGLSASSRAAPRRQEYRTSGADLAHRRQKRRTGLLGLASLVGASITIGPAIGAARAPAVQICMNTAAKRQFASQHATPLKNDYHRSAAPVFVRADRDRETARGRIRINAQRKLFPAQ